jgi:hypothetical protein
MAKIHRDGSRGSSAMASSAPMVQHISDAFRFAAFDHGIRRWAAQRKPKASFHSIPAVELAALSFSDGHADHFRIPPVMSIDTAHPFDGEHLQARCIWETSSSIERLAA